VEIQERYQDECPRCLHTVTYIATGCCTGGDKVVAHDCERKRRELKESLCQFLPELALA